MSKLMTAGELIEELSKYPKDCVIASEEMFNSKKTWVSEWYQIKPVVGFKESSGVGLPRVLIIKFSEEFV